VGKIALSTPPLSLSSGLFTPWAKNLFYLGTKGGFYMPNRPGQQIRKKIKITRMNKEDLQDQLKRGTGTAKALVLLTKGTLIQFGQSVPLWVALGLRYSVTVFRIRRIRGFLGLPDPDKYGTFLARIRTKVLFCLKRYPVTQKLKIIRTSLITNFFQLGPLKF
jgi:hypothetical protein